MLDLFEEMEFAASCLEVFDDQNLSFKGYDAPKASSRA